MGSSEHHFEVPREGETEAQNPLGVFHVKSKNLNQGSDRPIKITRGLESQFRVVEADSLLCSLEW